MRISLPRYLAISLLIFTWFTSFSQQEITLSQAIEIGLKNNYSILLEKNQAQIDINNNTIGNAGFLPSISLGITQNNTLANTHQEQSSGTVKDVSNAKSSSLSAGVALNWTVFDGMNMFVNKKMLNVLEDLGQNGTRIVIEGTVSDITLTYYAIIQLGKLVRVAQDAVNLSVQRKTIAAAKVSLGAGSQLMLLQSTVDLNADSTRLIRNNTALVNLRVDLNRLLARDVTTFFSITDSISLNEPVVYDTLVNRALTQNSQLIAARLNQEISRLGVKESQSDRYPTVGLTAGYNYGTLNSQTGFLQYNQSYGPSYGFNISYNLFNGFNVNRAVKNAKVLMNSGELSTEETGQNLRAELLKLHNLFNSNLEVVKMQLSNVSVARENVDIAFEKYKLGSINDIELREIQKKLIDAEYELISAQFEAKKAEVELVRLSGELLR
jgi:outer membrane protein